MVGTNFKPLVEKANGQPYQFWLAGQISPSLALSFHEADVLGKHVVVLEIPAAERVTTKYRGIAYFRIGEATPPLADHPSYEEAIVAKITAFNWESGAAASFMTGADVLRFLDYRLYFNRLKLPVPESDSSILEALAADKLVKLDVGGRWNILNLGAALFAHKLDDFDRTKRKVLRVVRYSGRSKAAKATETPILSGYVHGFEVLLELLAATLPKSEELGRALRVEHPVYPETAIRELVANALIHQDMSITGSGPMIDVYDDRMEITNPGAPLVDPNRFLDSPPRSRNEAMASLLRRVGMCEERGSGVRKVISAIEVFQLPAPEFTGYGDSVRVTLFAPMKFSEMDTAGRVRACYQHAVLQYLTHQKMTNATLRKRFGIGKNNAAQVSGVIKQALESRQIRPSEPWSPRQGHYLPVWVRPS